MIGPPSRSTLFPYTTLFRSSRLSFSKHLAHNLGNLLLLGKIGVFHNRRNASSRLLRSEERSAGMPRPISYAVFCLKKKIIKHNHFVAFDQGLILCQHGLRTT